MFLLFRYAIKTAYLPSAPSHNIQACNSVGITNDQSLFHHHHHLVADSNRIVHGGLSGSDRLDLECCRTLVHLQHRTGHPGKFVGLSCGGSRVDGWETELVMDYAICCFSRGMKMVSRLVGG